MITTVAADAGAKQAVERALMLVDGQWVAAADGRFLEVENPANRAIIGEVPRGDTEDVDRAVRAAARAFESWKTVAPRERGKLLLKIADAMEANSEALSRLLATETGNAKQSGIGREFSLEGMLDSFTQRKSVTVNLQF